MSVQFYLPDMGEEITEAEVVRWLVQPGDHVEANQEVVEVQTDKALVMLPSPFAGVVASLHVAAGETAAVHTPLLTLDDVQEPLNGGLAERMLNTTNRQGKQGSAAVSAANGTKGMAEASHIQMLVTPVARKMARELHVDLARVQGTGPGGRIRTADIQRAATQLSPVPIIRNARENGNNGSKNAQPEEPPGLELHHPRVSSFGDEETATAENKPAPLTKQAERKRNSNTASLHSVENAPEELTGVEAQRDEERIPLRGLRKRIADSMVRSAQSIPQVTSFAEINASELVSLRHLLQPEAERQGVKLSYLPFVMKAVVMALARYPICNASFDEQRNEIVLRYVYHLGVATATPAGLLVPVIRDVDRLTLLEIARELQRVSQQARARTLEAHELRGSTFTLTNYGAAGGFLSTPLINPGESAILGLGRIEKRPWVVDDELAVCPVLPLSLTVDHRLIDGEEALLFLNTVTGFLEQPSRLLLHMR